MKTMKITIRSALTILFIAVPLLTGTVSAQILRVDSVKVDSVWNSDSSWNDTNNVLQQRQSRDCRVSFVPQGEGMARMFIALSIDSGKTWAPSPNPLIVPGNVLSSTFITGQKATITVRVLGGDRLGVAFKMTARQAAPAIAGNPEIKVLGVVTALTPGQNTSTVLSVSLVGDAGNGFCTIEKVYWDALGDGTIDDSTSGANAMMWTWLAQVPAVVAGQRKNVFVRAVDKNGLTSAPETLSVQFGLLRPIVMKDIPAGAFSMGEAGIAEPVHQVTLSAFKIQETEVTQEQYLAVTGNSPLSLAGDLTKPVENVTWFDAVEYCNALSTLSGLEPVYETTTWNADFTKNGYRLPTEAQWEYACRGGKTTTYWWGADSAGLGSSTWSSYNSGDTTHPVAKKQANSYGLYDMTGNVWEWCHDRYDVYIDSAQINPTGPPSGGQSRVLRGGAIDGTVDDFHSAARNYATVPGYWNVGNGFRCVLPK
jgi:formylglycine-generating enzyme required for sulfatase activity